MLSGVCFPRRNSGSEKSIMVITDPVGDLLTRIRNAAAVKKREVVVPYSKLREDIAKVLKKEGYAFSVKKEKADLKIEIAYKRRRPLITQVKNISRPGVRIYRKASKIREPLGGAGITIISTSQGVMSGKEAKKKGLGGEVLGEVW